MNQLQGNFKVIALKTIQINKAMSIKTGLISKVSYINNI